MTNLSPVVTIKDLFEVFREVGQVFDVFLPKDRLNGRGRGFGFVRFKTEWHANRAIRSLNGRMVGGRRIGVQKAKYVDRNSKKTCYSLAVKSTRKAFSAVSLQNQGVNSTYPPKASHGTNQAWTEVVGNFKVVKVAASLALALKKEVINSFVGTASCLDVTEGDILRLLTLEVKVQDEVKKFHSCLFWIHPGTGGFLTVGENGTSSD